MTRSRLPGDRLRALAARVCGPAAMTRVIDPVIADLQSEHIDAIRRGQTWRSRWVRLAGYVVFWKVIGLHATARAVPALREWAAADDRAIGRTLAFTVIATVFVTMVLSLLPLPSVVRAVHERVGGRPLARYRIGQLYVQVALQLWPAGLQIGFAVGILCGLHGRLATARVRRSIVTIGVASAALLFAFLKETPNPPGGLGAQFAQHQHWAASLTMLVMGVFAYSLSAAMGGKARSIPIGIVASVVYLFSYLIFFLPVVWGWLPPLVGAWLPNVVFSIAIIVLVRLEPDTAKALGKKLAR
jgi:hypothetical protein